MRAACFQSVEKVQTRDIPEPTLQNPTDIIVQVEMAGLCGSDLHPFFGREVGLDVGTVMGHELVGTVAVAGADVKSLSSGDRVFIPFSTNCGRCYYCESGLTSRCQNGQLFGWLQQQQGLDGCQSELVRIPHADATAKQLPTGLSAESALLLGDNFSTGYYCAEMAQIKPGSICAVVGLGTVGQLCVLSAMSMGADKVIAIDPVVHRRQLAEDHGALAVDTSLAVKTCQELTNGRGVDAVMELVGLPAAQKLAFQLVRPGGTMSVIGCHCTPNFAFSPVDAYDKNLTYKTGRCPARYYMELLTDRVANGEFDLDAFISHRFEIGDAENAYDIFANKKDGCIKAVFQFN